MYKDLHFYIDLNWEELTNNPEHYSQQTFQLVELIYQHKATVYYSKLQIDKLKDICQSDKNFMKSIGNKLDLILENAIPINAIFYSFEICFAEENTSLNYIKNEAISSIIANPKIALISYSERECTKTLLKIISNTEFEKLEFNIFNNKANIVNWIVCNSNNRVFHQSDKHGENGIGNWQNESVLLCSKEEAQDLLNHAIPDFIKKEKRLFVFDNVHETYIEFYYEGDNPQNQWHGFHINIDEWDNRIPNKIRKYFCN